MSKQLSIEQIAEATFEEERWPIHYVELSSMLLTVVKSIGQEPANSIRSRVATDSRFKRVVEATQVMDRFGECNSTRAFLRDHQD